MKKKGFTLIELLAVIVILAIIVLVTTPLILGVIKKARKGSALASSYGYADAIDNYQIVAEIKSNKKLLEGTYNVNKSTIINGENHEKINDLIQFKGKRPTAGTISINNKGIIGGLKLCIDNFVIQYTNNQHEIVSDDCEDIELESSYYIDNNEWAKQKILTITFPDTKYKRFYLVENGEVYLNDTKIQIGEEIESTSNSLKLNLKSNAKIKTWLLKNNNKIAVSSFEEAKIDNVELKTPTIVLNGSVPILTTSGVKLQNTLKIDYNVQDGTSAYYSEDDGITWKKYNGEISVTASSIKAKLVRDKSKLESEIDTKSGTTSDSTYLPQKTYDGDWNNDYSWYPYRTGQGPKKIKVSPGMQGKGYIVKARWPNTDVGNIGYYDSSNNLIKTDEPISVTNYPEMYNYIIPKNTEYISFTATPTSGTTDPYLMVYEIAVNNAPILNETNVYPLLTETGIEQPYNSIKITYFDTSVQKLYRINNGEWLNYANKTLKLEIGSKLEAKGIDANGVESRITTYTSNLPNDSLPQKTYDGDWNNDYSWYPYRTGQGPKKIKVSPGMQGKGYIVKARWPNTDVGNIGYYDSSNNLIKTDEPISVTNYPEMYNYIIPKNTEYISFTATPTSGTTDPYLMVYEVGPNNS